MPRWDTGGGCLGNALLLVGGFYAAVFLVAGIILAVEHFKP